MYIDAVVDRKVTKINAEILRDRILTTLNTTKEPIKVGDLCIKIQNNHRSNIDYQTMIKDGILTQDILNKYIVKKNYQQVIITENRQEN